MLNTQKQCGTTEITVLRTLWPLGDRLRYSEVACSGYKAKELNRPVAQGPR